MVNRRLTSTDFGSLGHQPNKRFERGLRRPASLAVSAPLKLHVEAVENPFFENLSLKINHL